MRRPAVLPLFFATVLVAVACGADGGGPLPGVEREVAVEAPTSTSIPPPPYVVGDSTGAQIRTAGALDGSVQSGCGFTGDSGWPVPCAIALDPPTTSVVIAGVSLWDIGAVDLAAYPATTDFYRSLGATVVWVAVPEVGSAFGTDDDVAAFNRRVADALGCALVDGAVRDAEYQPDNLHYTDAGAATVAERYHDLDAANACV